MWVAPFTLVVTSFLSIPLAVGQATSPPHYPSPWGSGTGDWADAYTKARAFVQQLTLLEKVNLTTGVGYESMEFWERESHGLRVTDGFTDGKEKVASGRMVQFLDLVFEVFACRTRPWAFDLVISFLH